MTLKREDGVTYLNRDEKEVEEKLSSLEEAEALKSRLLDMIKMMTNVMEGTVQEAVAAPAKEESTRTIQEQIDDRMNSIRDNTKHMGGIDRIKEQLQKELGNIKEKSAVNNRVVRLSEQIEEDVSLPLDKAERLRALEKKLDPSNVSQIAIDKNIEELRSIANMRMHNLSVKDSSQIKSDLLAVAQTLEEHIEGLETKIKVIATKLRMINSDMDRAIEYTKND